MKWRWCSATRSPTPFASTPGERPGDDDLEDVWPAGDLSIFADLGLDEMELGALLSDLDAYADETLLLLARRLGFAEAYERVVEPAFH